MTNYLLWWLVIVCTLEFFIHIGAAILKKPLLARTHAMMAGTSAVTVFVCAINLSRL